MGKSFHHRSGIADLTNDPAVCFRKNAVYGEIWLLRPFASSKNTDLAAPRMNWEQSSERKGDGPRREEELMRVRQRPDVHCPSLKPSSPAHGENQRLYLWRRESDTVQEAPSFADALEALLPIKVCQRS